METHYVDLSQPKTYPSVGECIYCRKTLLTTNHLGREHLVPESLAGNALLLKASCRDCETLTSQIERFISKSMLDILRARTGIAGKKRKGKVQNKTFPIYTELHGKTVEIAVQGAAYPQVLQIPIFYKPQLGLPYREPTSPVVASTVWAPYTQSELQEICSGLGVEYIQFLSGEVDLELFAKLLFKVAYSFAVAELGYSEFYPFDFRSIAGRSPSYPIGELLGYPDVWSADQSMRHPAIIREVVLNGRRFIQVDLSIFHDIGFPIYSCIVGFAKGEEKRRLFRRLMNLGRGNERVSAAGPSARLRGDWDWMCGRCGNIVIEVVF